MKRQGAYGFTFDSKAEEWARWAKSCLEHNPPYRAKDYQALMHMWLDYDFDGRTASLDAIIRRHSPAQQQNGCEIGEGSGRALLTPVGRLNLVLIATSLGMAIALWKGWL